MNSGDTFLMGVVARSRVGWLVWCVGWTRFPLNMAALPIHLRAKRGKQTVFLVADPSDTVRLLKSKLSEISRVTPDRIRIYAADKVGCAEAPCLLGDVPLNQPVLRRRQCTKMSPRSETTPLQTMISFTSFTSHVWRGLSRVVRCSSCLTCVVVWLFFFCLCSERR